jgi:hypothetical protein
MEIVTIILVAVIVLVGGLIFITWLTLAAARLALGLIWKGVGLLWQTATGQSLGAAPPRPFATARRLTTAHCSNPKCRALLPASARFCVRCGTSTLSQARRVA